MATNVLRGFASIFGSNVARLILGLITTPLLVRFLGTAEYGNYAFLLSILGITMILTNAGIFDGTRKFIAEERAEGNWKEHVFGLYFRVALLLAALAAAIYVAFGWLGFSDQWFAGEFELYFVLLGLLVVCRQSHTIARGGLMGLGFEDRSEPLGILQKLLFAIIGLSLAYVGYGIVGVLLGNIVATLVTSIIAYRILFQHIDVRSVVTRTPSRFPVRELLTFNSLSVVLILLTASLYHVDILLLRLFVGKTATGYYKAALVIAEFLWFVPFALQTVLLHSSSKLWAEDRIDEISNLASKTTRYNISLVLLLAIGLAALAADFVPLYYGSGFDASIRPLLLLLPGVLGFALARPIFAVGQGRGKLGVLILATFVAALMNLSMNIFLIPRFGMTGAAIATSISYGSMLLFHVLAAHRIGFDPVNDLRVLRLMVVGVVTGIVVFGISATIESSILSLVVVPPIGFVVYTALTLKLGVIDPEELDVFTGRLPGPFDSYVTRVLDVL